jgi:ferredoxin
MGYKVTIENSAETYQCSAEQSLLRGMESLGKGGIPVGCRGGGCGVCKIQVTSGTYVKKTMSRAFITREEEAEQVLLACRCYPTSDISLKVVGKMEKAVVSDDKSEPSDKAGFVSFS